MFMIITSILSKHTSKSLLILKILKFLDFFNKSQYKFDFINLKEIFDRLWAYFLFNSNKLYDQSFMSPLY